MRARIVGVLAAAAAAVVAGAPVVSQAAPARPHKTTTSWCDAGATGACVVSATRNGVAVTKDDPSWDIIASTVTGASKDVLVSIQRVTDGDPYDLQTTSLTDVWKVTIAMGAIVPRVVFVAGDGVTVDRQPVDRTDYDVTITASPVVTTNQNDCDQSKATWTCATKASSERTTLSAEITDYGSWADPVQRAAFYGMDFSTNVALTTIPPSIVSTETPGGLPPGAATHELDVQLANQHSHPDSSTFLGFVHLVIPNAFLKAVYGIDDPSTVTASGLTASAGVGMAKVSDVGSALRVDATGITFSQRFLKVKRGSIAPTTPKIGKVHRIGATKATVGYQPSKARGSKILGYTARCSAPHHLALTATRTNGVITVTRLLPGVAYTCAVRANAKHAKSAFSKPKKAAALP